jgi:hypothetical protein
MKRSTLFLLPALVLFIALTGAAIQTTDTCDTKALKDKAKAALDPFNYDSGKVTRLFYKKKEQLKEIEIPVFVGERYRFVFNTEGITRDVKVAIYNKDKDAKNRKELFSFDAATNKDVAVWEPTGRSMHYYVDYNIPAVSDSLPPSECMVMMIGYK